MSLDVLANDSIAPDVGETLTITGVTTGSAGGSITVVAGTSINYQPAANFFGSETFTYTINDGTPGSDATATVTINVTPVNDLPTASDDLFTVDEDSSAVSLDVLANDSIAPDVGETLTITGVTTGSAGGSITVVAGTSINYQPAANFFGSETFTYTINDGTPGSDATATVNINVTPVNDLPTASDDLFTVDEDSPAVALDVLANDSVAPDAGETLTITSVTTGSAGGSITVVAGTSINYQPAANFFGSETFTYTINDGTPGSDATATVTINVTPVNDLPTASDDLFTVDEDSLAVSLDVLANDSVVPDAGETLTITGVTTGSAGGSVTVVAGGIQYLPQPNFSGTETFKYTINDGTPGSDATATVTVMVSPANDVPVANDDTFTASEDSSAVSLDVLANDSTAPDVGETLTITGVTTGSAGGSIAVVAGTSISYQPAANYFGSETFTYTINDGTPGNDATGTVTLSVTPVNDLPLPGDDAFTVDEDSPAVALDVLANDSIAPDTSETLTITGVTTGSAGGSVTVDAGTSISYQPAANFFGSETFTYTINDGTPGSDATATVTINVTPVNDLPTASDDLFTVDEDSPAVSLDVLANDSIAPDVGETLTITGVTTGSAGGSITVVGGTSIRYQPAANFFGSETFTYTINDGTPGSDATAAVTINVTPVNDLPTASDDLFTVDEDSLAVSLDVLANDSVVPDAGETLTIAGVTTGLAGGSITVVGGTSIRYQPAANFFGNETFTYTINDGTPGSDATATVTVTVSPTNDVPVANDDTFTASEDSSAVSLDVLANDSVAPDAGETLTITGVTTGSAGGSITVVAGTSIRYQPAANFFGSETFTYTINDGTPGSDATATVTVTVSPTNDVPVANDDTFTASEDSSAVSLDVLANDSVAPDAGETLTITGVTTGSAGGSIAVVAGTSIRYQPAANFFGSETFTYTINDGTPGSDATATVTINVTPVNDLPTASDDLFTVDEDSLAVSLDVLANDSTAPDVGETLTITGVTTGSAGGSITVVAGTSINYQPAANFFGSETFTYTINDGTPGSDATATVTVNVTPVNDLPTASDDLFTVDEDSSAVSLDVLANDSIAPDAGETLTITGVTTGSAGGSITVVSGTSIRYQPAANFFGSETFTYTINDGTPGSDATATVTVTVSPTNDVPVANDDTFAVIEDSSRVLLDVLANDNIGSDVGETLTITNVTAGSDGGNVAVFAGSSISYQPAADFFGAETFIYTINDGTTGNDATATVTVTVSPINDPPVANDDTFTVDEDSPIVLLDVLANDSAAPDLGETLTITGVTTPSAGGSVSLVAGTISYQPAADYFGRDVFYYAVNDGSPIGDVTAAVTVNVTPVNDPPVAVNDTFTVPEGSPAVVLDVLSNDSITPDAGETLTVVSVTTPSVGGSVAVIAGTIRYQPAANYVGSETFTYTINDGTPGSDATATVTVNVTPSNAAELTLTIPAPSISEGDGANATTATVIRNTDTTNALTVTLVSSDTSEATVPATVTIPAGQSSVSFGIDAVDDTILDGTQTVSITASAAGHADGGDSLDVLDDEISSAFIRRFDFGTATSPVESGYARVTGTTAYSSSLGHGWFGGTVKSLERGPGTDLTRDFNYQRVGTFVVDVPVGTYQVTLTSGDGGPYEHDQQIFLEGVSVDTFTTPAGDVAIRTYTVTVVDGQLTLFLDGSGGIDPNMVINALQVTSGSALTVSIGDAAIYEGGGRTTGTVERSGSTSEDLIVTLVSNDTSEATVPQTVTISAGQSSTSFDIDAVDDATVDGTHTVTITASAAGFGSGSDTLDVLDNDASSVFERRFDFGTATSPLEPDYTRVTGTTAYSNSLGHGWLGGTVKSLDRGPGTDLTRDFNYQRVGTFVIDVPVGTYEVTLTAGDGGPYPHDQEVFLEGVLVDAFMTPASDVVIRTYTVTVVDGQLTLLLDGSGGTDPNMVINALQVIAVPNQALALTNVSFAAENRITSGGDDPVDVDPSVLHSRGESQPFLFTSERMIARVDSYWNEMQDAGRVEYAGTRPLLELHGDSDERTDLIDAVLAAVDLWR